jgi:outer membrane protein OmpA-like peptidoglycan-associated protein
MVGFTAEAGALFLVDPSNRSLFGVGVGGALDLEVNLHPLLGVQAGGFFNYFTPGATQDSTLYGGGRAGLRFHWSALIPRFGHDFWADLHGTYGISGAHARPGLDAGLGFDFRLVRHFRLGPFGRFHWASDPLGNHPMFVTAGLELQFLGDPRSASADADRDGVGDSEDQCPGEPAGAQPDPRRQGCPQRDTDADAVFDADDQCPTEPAGARPDPSRPGCPTLDRDRDGVPDRDDRCPDRAGAPPSGCPYNDADHDGVNDAEDRCPTSPRGEHPDPEQAGCPDGDDDADGVINHGDQCRTQPRGLRPDPTRPGCPLPDRDNDFIPDTVDACPDQPGTPNRNPRLNGCVGLALVRDGQIRIQRPVFFAPRRDRILGRSRAVLDAVAEAMLASPEIERLSIEGHTDDVGDDQQNLQLSQRRAANVIAFLVQRGVEPQRLEAHGFGETRPLVQPPTADARSVNRRVEFHLVRYAGRQLREVPTGGARVSGDTGPTRDGPDAPMRRAPAAP